MELDFILGAKTAFETSMMAIFNHKQLRAAEILAKQMEDQENASSSVIIAEKPSTDEIMNFEKSLEATNDEKKIEDGSTISNTAASVDKISATEVKSASSSEHSTSESSDALRQAIEAKKDEAAELKDLNNDVKFVPDLEGGLSRRWSPFSR